jgi:hypothetical protein
MPWAAHMSDLTAIRGFKSLRQACGGHSPRYHSLRCPSLLCTWPPSGAGQTSQISHKRSPVLFNHLIQALRSASLGRLPKCRSEAQSPQCTAPAGPDVVFTVSVSNVALDLGELVVSHPGASEPPGVHIVSQKLSDGASRVFAAGHDVAFADRALDVEPCRGPECRSSDDHVLLPDDGERADRVSGLLWSSRPLCSARRDHTLGAGVVVGAHAHFCRRFD